MHTVSRTHFINVDLDVYSTKSLKVLADAMERASAITLHCGRMAPGEYPLLLNLVPVLGPQTPASADSCA
jgi:hypothetical protein